MKTYLDDLLPGSINGVPVHIDSSDMPVGFRIIAKARPFSDNHWVDVLGKRIKVLRFRAFILDNNGDLAKQRDAVFKALETPGVDTVVHPRLGEIKTHATATWSTRGGRENFNVVCYPPTDNTKSSVKPRTDKNVENACSDARDALGKEAAEALQLDGNGLAARAQGVLDKGVATLRKINGSVSIATAPIGDIALSIDALGRDAARLIRTPSYLASQFGSVIDAVYGGVNAASNAFLSPSEILRSQSGQGSRERVTRAFTHYVQLVDGLEALPPVVGTTPSRNQERVNQDVIARLMQGTALLALCNYVASQSRVVNVGTNESSPFDSVNDAREKRDVIADALATLSTSVSVKAFNDVRDVRVQWIRHIDNHGQGLPRLEAVQFANPLPAVVIAYEVHGDARQVDDLVRRNRIRSPLRVEAYTPLEVLRAR